MKAGGIVLCGGKSIRMGTPKAWLPFGPETMLQRVVRLLSDVVAPIVVVAAADQPLPPLPADVLVARDAHEDRGPLEGLRIGLQALPDGVEAAYVTSCDAPLLVPGFVTRMLDLVEGYDAAVVEIDGFPHPLSAVYRRAVLPQIDDLLRRGQLRASLLTEGPRTRRVTPADVSIDPDLRTLRNVNTRDDYAAALEAAGVPGSLDVP